MIDEIQPAKRDASHRDPLPFAKRPGPDAASDIPYTVSRSKLRRERQRRLRDQAKATELAEIELHLIAQRDLPPDAAKAIAEAAIKIHTAFSK
jgi:hypothetical protein